MTKTIRYNTHINTIHVKEWKHDTLFIHTLQKSFYYNTISNPI